MQAALAHCSDGSDPVAWLKANWSSMIDTVRTLATNYGHERRENTVGTISANEAKEALRLHRGNVWAAVTECVEQRQKKVELFLKGTICVIWLSAAQIIFYYIVFNVFFINCNYFLVRRSNVAR